MSASRFATLTCLLGFVAVGVMGFSNLLSNFVFTG